MHGGIYPIKYMEKQLIGLKGQTFSCHKSHRFKLKPSAVGRANNIELLMLVLDFVMNSMLENTQWHFCGIHGMC